MNCCLTLHFLLPMSLSVWFCPEMVSKRRGVGTHFWGVLAEHCAYTPWDRFKLWYSCAEQQSCAGTFHLKKRCRHTSQLKHMAALYSSSSLSLVQLTFCFPNRWCLCQHKTTNFLGKLPIVSRFLFTTITTFYRRLIPTTREADISWYSDKSQHTKMLFKLLHLLVRQNSDFISSKSVQATPIKLGSDLQTVTRCLC